MNYFARFLATLLFAWVCICQARPVERQVTPLQKIVEVRGVRGSMDKREDSLVLRLNIAIAAHNAAHDAHGIVKKNR